jgi:hypothetical protein
MCCTHAVTGAMLLQVTDKSDLLLDATASIMGDNIVLTCPNRFSGHDMQKMCIVDSVMGYDVKKSGTGDRHFKEVCVRYSEVIVN